ncbi:unnamed protein product [Rhizophagus irregularis]|uniref:Uncharacterized protein n=1 Tax=Rhizophagus irregularis TaxID=588596 RepID=A0A915Z4H8_9GLOM|nr:unnamed protein product [Rhizophagus irregularis]
MTFWLHQNDSFYNIVNSLKIYIEKAYYRYCHSILKISKKYLKKLIAAPGHCSSGLFWRARFHSQQLKDHFEYKFRILTMR